MTIVLLILLGICIVFIFQQWRVRQRIVKTSSRLIHQAVLSNVDLEQKLDEANKNYKALDEGQQEVVDNYENDLLDMREKKEAAQNAAKYDRERREEVEKKLEQANQIIEKHSDKCDILVEDIADMLIAEALPPSE